MKILLLSATPMFNRAEEIIGTEDELIKCIEKVNLDKSILFREKKDVLWKDKDDQNQTSLEEQRQTEWMRFYSLQQALDPKDLNRTIEGHPAPLRAALTARYRP